MVRWRRDVSAKQTLKKGKQASTKEWTSKTDFHVNSSMGTPISAVYSEVYWTLFGTPFSLGNSTAAAAAVLSLFCSLDSLQWATSCVRSTFFSFCVLPLKFPARRRCLFLFLYFENRTKRYGGGDCMPEQWRWTQTVSKWGHDSSSLSKTPFLF